MASSMTAFAATSPSSSDTAGQSSSSGATGQSSASATAGQNSSSDTAGQSSVSNTAGQTSAAVPTAVVASTPTAAGGSGISGSEKSAMTYRSPEAIQAIADAYGMTYAEVANNAVTQPAEIPKDDVYAVAQKDKILINGIASTQKVIIRKINKKKAAYKAAKTNLYGGKLINYFDVFLPAEDGNTVTVNFLVPRIKGGEALSVQQFVDGAWVNIAISEIRKDHVVVDLTRSGSIRFLIGATIPEETPADTADTAKTATAAAPVA